MKTRMGTPVTRRGVPDASGYVECELDFGTEVSVREIHLSDLRTENDADERWLAKACSVVAELAERN